MLKLRFQEFAPAQQRNSAAKGSRRRADCREKFGTTPLFPGRRRDPMYGLAALITPCWPVSPS
jgi:hypothetical protein